MTPHPAVYSPSLWRRYQDTLVRYEQLLRAGDPTKKTIDLAGRLAGMEKTLKSEARLDVADPVLSLSLPMASTLGVPLPVPDAEFKKRLQQVWEAAKEEQRPESMSQAVDWAKKHDDVRMTQVRTQAYRALLGFLANSKTVSDADLVGAGGEGESRSKAQVILVSTTSKLNAPRGRRGHFATMLLRRRPPRVARSSTCCGRRSSPARPPNGPPWRRPRTGKHPYSEVLYPWVRRYRQGRRRPPARRRLPLRLDQKRMGQRRRLLEQADAGYAESQSRQRLPLRPRHPRPPRK